MGSRFLGRGVLSVESWSAAELVRTCTRVLAGEQVGGARLGVLAGSHFPGRSVLGAESWCTPVLMRRVCVHILGVLYS